MRALLYGKSTGYVRIICSVGNFFYDCRIHKSRELFHQGSKHGDEIMVIMAITIGMPLNIGILDVLHV